MNYMDQLRRDKQKQEFCDLNDIQLVEVYDKDVLSKSLFKKLGINL
jgi:hypothetical protein